MSRLLRPGLVGLLLVALLMAPSAIAQEEWEEQGPSIDEVVNRKSLRSLNAEFEELMDTTDPQVKLLMGLNIQNADQFPVRSNWSSLISLNELNVMAPHVSKLFAKAQIQNGNLKGELVDKVTQEQKTKWWEADYRSQCVQWTHSLEKTEWPWPLEPGRLTFDVAYIQVVVRVSESDWESVRGWKTGKRYTYQATLVDRPTNREENREHLLLEVDWGCDDLLGQAEQTEQKSVAGTGDSTGEQVQSLPHLRWCAPIV